MQLYKLPTGAVVSLYAHPMFAPVKWCPRHGMVSRWHHHFGKADFFAAPTVYPMEDLPDE